MNDNNVYSNRNNQEFFVSSDSLLFFQAFLHANSDTTVTVIEEREGIVSSRYHRIAAALRV